MRAISNPRAVARIVSATERMARRQIGSPAGQVGYPKSPSGTVCVTHARVSSGPDGFWQALVDLKRQVRRGSALAVLFGTILCGRSARADEAGRDAAAQILFDEAKALMERGLYVQACEKLEESDRLDPALGTLFNLADCYERVGKTASAWSLFLQASAAATARGRLGAARIASERAEKLAAVVPRLTIRVTGSESTPGLIVKHGQVVLSLAQWDVPIPVDPGSHEITATAPGRVPWFARVLVNPGEQTAELRVPVLQAEQTAKDDILNAASAPLVRRPSAPRTPSEPQLLSSAPPRASTVPPPLVHALGGGGVAGIGVGLVLGALAKSQYDAANCAGNVCSKAGGEERDSAYLKANVATVLCGVGAAALATAVTLWVLLPEPGDRATNRRSPGWRVGIRSGVAFPEGRP